MFSEQHPLAHLARDLTENGLQFLRRAVYQLNSEQSTLESLSFAIVDLATSVEVLLKARLVQEHWTLIASNLDKVTVPSVLSGDISTVAPDQAVKRLENIVGIDLRTDGRIAQLETLTKLRNRAIHFSSSPTPISALQASLAEGLDFVLWLLDHEFRRRSDGSVAGLVEACIEELTTLVGKINILVGQRMLAIAAELDRADVCVDCPRCAQPALTLTRDIASHCVFCLWTPTDAADCAEEYASTLLSRYEALKDGIEWPVYNCPACSQYSLVSGIRQVRPDLPSTSQEAAVASKTLPAHWGCFGCGMTARLPDIDFCSRCGEPVANPDEEGLICGTCWREVIRD